MKLVKPFTTFVILVSTVILFACGSQTAAQETKSFEGKWQGMTYGTGAYDPMFTFIIKPNGTWIDMTFGEAKSIKSKTSYDKKTKSITLYSTKGSKLYTFKFHPALKDQKERLVEQLPANETYRAMVCYHKT